MKFVFRPFGFQSFVLRALLAAACLCPAVEAQTSTRFAAYARCHFADDLRLVENTPLAQGVLGRTVKTVMGPRQVPLAGGVRLMYAYPETEPLANVKVEHIPTDAYAQARQDLIANFDQILTADDSSTRNYTLKPRVNGLEIYGLDRKKLEGGVLGIYVFFVDSTHTVTTIYFLNQDPSVRKFSSLEEYAKLRDAFVETYTACAAGHPHPAGPGTVVAASTTPAEPPAETPDAASPAPVVDAPSALLARGAPSASSAAIDAAASAGAKPDSRTPVAAIRGHVPTGKAKNSRSPVKKPAAKAHMPAKQATSAHTATKKKGTAAKANPKKKRR